MLRVCVLLVFVYNISTDIVVFPSLDARRRKKPQGMCVEGLCSC